MYADEKTQFESEKIASEPNAEESAKSQELSVNDTTPPPEKQNC